MGHAEDLAPGTMRGRRKRRGAGLLDLGEIAAQHGRHELQLGHVGHGGDRDSAPVAHNRDTVADPIQLVELVADEDDGDALLFQAADCLEQDADLLLVERGSRFVHDHQLGLERDSAGDGHHLLDGGAVMPEGRLHIDVDRKFTQQRACTLVHAPPGQQAKAVTQLTTEIDIFGDGAERDEIDLLKDRAHAAPLGDLRRRGCPRAVR